MRRRSVLVAVLAAVIGGGVGLLPSTVADATPPIASDALGAGSVLELTVAGVAGVPADALAVALNTTVTNPSGPGFLTVWPCGSPRPLASNLNYVVDETVPNLVVSKLGTCGRVCIYSQTTVDVIADVAATSPLLRRSGRSLPSGSWTPAAGRERRPGRWQRPRSSSWPSRGHRGSFPALMPWC